MGICVEGVRVRVRGDGAMRRRGDGERWGCRRDEVSGESVRPAGEGERVECGQATASSATDWDRSVPHSSGKQSSKFLYMYRCLIFTQTQSDQNPQTKSAIFSTLSITFLLIGGDRKDILPFLDARDPYLSNGTNAVLSISLEKKSIFSIRSFSSVPP